MVGNADGRGSSLSANVAAGESDSSTSLVTWFCTTHARVDVGKIDVVVIESKRWVNAKVKPFKFQPYKRINEAVNRDGDST